jgi:serine/threonine protein kinase
MGDQSSHQLAQIKLREWFSTTSENVNEGFQVNEKLGQGSFATVYKATHISTGLVIALKRITIEDEELDKKEIELLETCNSEYVVKYFGKKSRVFVFHSKIV